MAAVELSGFASCLQEKGSERSVQCIRVQLPGFTFFVLQKKMAAVELSGGEGVGAECAFESSFWARSSFASFLYWPVLGYKRLWCERSAD